MEEEIKLQEAERCYKEMKESIDFEVVFKDKLSAFLSASRSVLQYLLENVKIKPSGQSWYDNLVQNSKYVKYFKDKHDENIHQKTIQTKKGIDIDLNNDQRQKKIIY